MYTFSELLTIFFHLQKHHADIQTQGEFATAIESSRRTVAGWFAGDYCGQNRADCASALFNAIANRSLTFFRQF